MKGRGLQRRRTLGVELEDVDVAVCVRDGHVELFVGRQEGGGHHFDGARRFAEEAELVGFLLQMWCQQPLFMTGEKEEEN